MYGYRKTTDEREATLMKAFADICEKADIRRRINSLAISFMLMGYKADGHFKSWSGINDGLHSFKYKVVKGYQPPLSM